MIDTASCAWKKVLRAVCFPFPPAVLGAVCCLTVYFCNGYRVHDILLLFLLLCQIYVSKYIISKAVYFSIVVGQLYFKTNKLLENVRFVVTRVRRYDLGDLKWSILLYLKWISNKDLQYSTQSSAQCYVERSLVENGCMCMYGYVPLVFT